MIVPFVACDGCYCTIDRLCPCFWCRDKGGLGLFRMLCLCVPNMYFVIVPNIGHENITFIPAECVISKVFKFLCRDFPERYLVVFDGVCCWLCFLDTACFCECFCVGWFPFFLGDHELF